MSIRNSCEGNGQCFVDYSCECECFENCECMDDECNCDHKEDCYYNAHPEHKDCVIYCRFKKDCCELKKCGNYFLCKNLMPEVMLNRNDGLCHGCYLQLGHLKKGDIVECIICCENKENIKLNCGHEMCFGCFERWAFENEDRTCPMCRNPN
jgi:hypothetical protein